jgi:subtilisin family serine protease
VPDEVLAVFSASTPETIEVAVAARFSLVLLERTTLPLLDQRVVRFRIPDGRATPAVVTSVAGDANVSLAQPNFIYRPQQAAGASVQSSLQYSLAKVDLAAARSMAVGRGAVVAVIDTGIDTEHEDLRGSDVRIFETTGSEATKPDSHGTAIAGIIAAHGMLEGIAPAARLIGIRAFTPNTAGAQYSTTVMVLKAMDLAIAQHARAINLSFAGPADLLMEKAIGAVKDRGAIIVAAAGNNGRSAPPCYPAAYPGVIAVTAVDADDHLYAKANVGAYVAVAAPGVDVLVPTPGNNRVLESGTSFAAAHVTGIIALMLERNAQLTPEQARAALADGAIDLGDHGPDAEFGAGRVNAAASLRLVSTTAAK